MALSPGRIRQADLHTLVERMAKSAYRAKEATDQDEKVLQHCLHLCGKDYKYSVITNTNGELCNHYPTKLILLEYECKDGSNNGHHESIYNMTMMTDLFTKARFARCRTRFVIPVILIEGKHICRSATISSGAEMYGRSGINMVLNSGGSVPNEAACMDSQANGDWQLFDRIRGQDIKLLKELNIKHICDLMLETKKVKYFVNVTSSEKVDKENRYSDFSLWSLPYPGCEFFKIWRDKDYAGDRALFDWSQEYVNTVLEFPPDKHLAQLGIRWQDYKNWSLVQITQNYLRVLLQHVREGDSGLLIHCISGWDRTPLFISLLRLSLWADGLIHKSLSALEILYLTVAYDWYQFGHNLPDRLLKGEEIFFFCFYFLKFIQEDEFIVKMKTGGRNVRHTDSELNCSGLLLESDFPPFGSSTSLASDTSYVSAGGSTAGSTTDTPPQLFMVGCPEDDGTMSSAASCGATSRSTPVLVPGHVRKSTGNSPATDHRSASPVVGSWQVITGTGSLMGSASPYSHRSSSSGETPLAHGSGSFSELPEHEPSPRRKRLEEVRVLFYNAYGSTIGFKNGPDNASGGISSLLDMFAEKVVAFSTKLT